MQKFVLTAFFCWPGPLNMHLEIGCETGRNNPVILVCWGCCMTINHLEEGLAGFLAAPGPESAFRLISHCRGYLANIAAGWREPGLNRLDKIRELASEMLLILLEDFDRARVVHPKSVLAFVHQRLKRLTRRQRREIAFGLADSLPEIGRTEFTARRLEFADEIFRTVRDFLVSYPNEMASQLAFLFIHIFPEVPWASRMLAEQENAAPDRRLEADKKRMALFNNQLRQRFKKLELGEWREVTSWNSGERSHLAWRIISISPAEVSAAVADDLAILDTWRERIDRRQAQSPHDLAAALRVHRDMRARIASPEMCYLAAEEAAPWGDPADFLLQIIGKCPELYQVAESTGELQVEELATAPVDDGDDPDFIRLAEELSHWFGTLQEKRTPENQKKGQPLFKYS